MFNHRPWSGTTVTAEGDTSRDATIPKNVHDIKLDAQDSINQEFSNVQRLLPMLESIAESFITDRPIKLETFSKLSIILKQHCKIKG